MRVRSHECGRIVWFPCRTFMACIEVQVAVKMIDKAKLAQMHVERETVVNEVNILCLR